MGSKGTDSLVYRSLFMEAMNVRLLYVDRN